MTMITKSFFRRWVPWLGLVLILAVAACGSSSSASSAPAVTGTTSAPAATGTTASAPAASGTVTSSAPAASASTETIVIKNFMFSPMSLTVAAGATVTVHNEDSVTHTLTDKADATLFNTGDVGPGQTKTFTAPAKVGSYPFLCTIHQYMVGTLIVQ